MTDEGRAGLAEAIGDAGCTADPHPVRLVATAMPGVMVGALARLSSGGGRSRRQFASCARSLARSGGEAAAALSGVRCDRRPADESEAVQRIPNTRRPIANMRCAPGAQSSLSKPTMRRTFAPINPVANFTILVSRAARSAFVATCSPTASRTVFTMGGRVRFVEASIA